MPNEIELKLRIAPDDVSRLYQHPLVVAHQISPAISRQLTSIYYDTPDWHLKKAHTSLRVRHMEGSWFQAVKSAGKVINGLHTRMEWEDLLTSSTPDFTKIAHTEMGAFFSDKALQKALRPIFVTEMQRTEWQLHLPDGHIELSLDIGHVTTCPTSTHTQAGLGLHNDKIEVCEIELELKQGEEAILVNFAKALQQDIQLTEENTSKAGLGYALLGVA